MKILPSRSSKNPTMTAVMPEGVHAEMGDDHIMTVTINRPKSRNSLDLEACASAPSDSRAQPAGCMPCMMRCQQLRMRARRCSSSVASAAPD